MFNFENPWLFITKLKIVYGITLPSYFTIQPFYYQINDPSQVDPLNENFLNGGGTHFFGKIQMDVTNDNDLGEFIMAGENFLGTSFSISLKKYTFRPNANYTRTLETLINKINISDYGSGTFNIYLNGYRMDFNKP